MPVERAFSWGSWTSREPGGGGVHDIAQAKRRGYQGRSFTGTSKFTLVIPQITQNRFNSTTMLSLALIVMTALT